MLPKTRVAERDDCLRWPRETRRNAIDWNAVEHDYRAGVLSLRELARKHECSHSAIANFAGRHGWIRDPVSHKAYAPKNFISERN